VPKRHHIIIKYDTLLELGNTIFFELCIFYICTQDIYMPFQFFLYHYPRAVEGSRLFGCKMANCNMCSCLDNWPHSRWLMQGHNAAISQREGQQTSLSKLPWYYTAISSW